VSSPSSHYALGSHDAEHERLIRQAAWLAPYSERCFREAGIGIGHRVLDVGSGVGDVALLLARLVGSSGEVVGIERNPRSISRARARIEEARLHNVQFIESDVAQVRSDKLFDAAVGRYILMFLPDPASVLRSLSQLVRPGGVLVFQEASYSSFVAAARLLPLWLAGASLIQRSFGAAEQTQKWHRFCPEFFEMLVCQRHQCVVISCLVRVNGWSMFCEACTRSV